MKLSDRLPTFTKLDREFSKSAEEFFDILYSIYKKRIDVCVLLSDDLLSLTKSRLKRKTSWKTNCSVAVPNVFPKAERNRTAIGDFSSDWLENIEGFEFNIEIRKNTKAVQGIFAQLFLTLNSLSWYAGQFQSVSDAKEIFDYNYYLKTKSNIGKLKSNKSEIIVAFPDTPDEYDEHEKYIGLEIYFDEIQSKQDIIKHHNIFKEKILAPMLTLLK